LAQLHIGPGNKTFIIAEAGINHNGDMTLALRMVAEAKKAGADAIKFQTYETDKRVARDNPVYDILKKCELSQEQQKRIKEYADKVGILFFSTPFDEESVRFLRELNVPLMKIASFDIVNKKLLDAVSKTQIPVIASRGMANQEEIDEAVKIFKDYGVDFAILHCVSAYPTPKEAVNMRMMHTLQAVHSCPVGFSDHTLDLDASIYAVAAGAHIIEKHFTLDRNIAGPDQKMSVDPQDLLALCKKIREVEMILGSGEIRQLPEEEGAKIFRRPTEI